MSDVASSGVKACTPIGPDRMRMSNPIAHSRYPLVARRRDLSDLSAQLLRLQRRRRRRPGRHHRDKLDYVASLGVDAIWLSPFFASPMKDFGYDVSDYRAVDPIFGTLDDFDRLVARAHELGLQVIIDQVYAHTSDAHPWFQESRAGRSNAKADWYVWADPKPDGTPPNNWLSVFYGPSWTWDGRRAPILHAQFPALAAQPQCQQSGGAGGAARHRALLAGARRRWLPAGCHQFRHARRQR